MVIQKDKNVNNGRKKVLLSGGGTGGSVSPLLAIFDELKEKDYDFCWVGTEDGPEKSMVGKEGIEFFVIRSGKFRRYFSWRNFIDPFFVILGFFDSCKILKKCRPDIVMSAGGFVSVPLVWAAWLKRIPIITHQQDARPGLANKLMCHFSRVVTTAFQSSVKDFCKKAIWIGNPVRRQFIDLQEKNNREESLKKFNLKSDKPIIFVMGGGTGSIFLNILIVKSLQELTKNFQIIHITGKDRGVRPPLEWKYDLHAEDYHKFEFLDISQIVDAYNVADIVVSRCGMGALTELSFLQKVSILIPIPSSHQEDNARIFKDNEAALVLDQNYLDSHKFIKSINSIFYDQKKQEMLKKNIGKIIRRDAVREMEKIIIQIIDAK